MNLQNHSYSKSDSSLLTKDGKIKLFQIIKHFKAPYDYAHLITFRFSVHIRRFDFVIRQYCENEFVAKYDACIEGAITGVTESNYSPLLVIVSLPINWIISFSFPPSNDNHTRPSVLPCFVYSPSSATKIPLSVNI